LKPDILKPDVLQPDFLWVYQKKVYMGIFSKISNSTPAANKDLDLEITPLACAQAGFQRICALKNMPRNLNEIVRS
jgi:hypothetical protein